MAQNEKVYKQGQALNLRAFLKTLESASSVLAEWDDEGWMVMDESAMIHRDKSITFKFFNGKEIKVQ